MSASARRSFIVSPRSESTFEPFTVDAEYVDEAAGRAARKLWGSSVGCHRVTGTYKKSGVFQSYVTMGQRGGDPPFQSSIGGNFHVTEA